MPKENEIIFTAPTGEEITTKKQLQHTWSHTRVVRQSLNLTRISGKKKVVPLAVESETLTKWSRKSSVSKKDLKDKKETESAKDVEMPEAKKHEKDVAAVEAEKVVKQKQDEGKMKTWT